MLIVHYGNSINEKEKLSSCFSFNKNIGNKLSIHNNENSVPCYISENENHSIILIGKIYNIGDNKFESYDEKISDYILQNYNDNSIFKTINGEFIIIVLNKFDNSILVCRDQMGCMPFYYFKSNNSYTFSTHIKTLIKHFENPLEIDYRWFINSLTYLYNDKQITNYKNIFRLPSGHYLKISDKNSDLIQYYKIEDVEINKSENLDYKTSFQNLLIESVEKRIKSHTNVSCELSGGLDSSALTCITAQFKQKTDSHIFAFSHTLPDEALEKIFPFKDEREFSKLVADKYSNVSHIYIDLKEVSLLELMRQIVLDLGYVPENNFIKYIIEPVRLSKKNKSDILLSGFGGDEFVSYQGYIYIRELIRAFKFKNVRKYFKLYCEHNSFNTIKGIFSLFTNMYLVGLLNLNKLLFKKYSETSLINKNNSPKNLRYLIYKSKKIVNKKTLNKVLADKISNPLLNLRIEACSEYSLLQGVNYVFPLVDIDLIQYYYSIPSEIKSSPLETRHLFRQAIIDIVPKKIRTRNDKSGATIPSVQYSYLKDYEKITEFIISCKNNLKTHYINYDEMLQWHSNLKHRKNNKGKIKMSKFMTVLNFLVFQYMFENGEIK
ncbi:MAG: hypothetical protein A2046_14490 [Bacteroidetes bacterium GWA2_30_7]|nr:MAG: hypothetical protein A2046_14490 [Bacteroidetes bacterium GWA2_30_7]